MNSVASILPETVGSVQKDRANMIVKGSTVLQLMWSNRIRDTIIYSGFWAAVALCPPYLSAIQDGDYWTLKESLRISAKAIR